MDEVEEYVEDDTKNDEVDNASCCFNCMVPPLFVFIVSMWSVVLVVVVVSDDLSVASQWAMSQWMVVLRPQLPTILFTDANDDEA